MKPICIIGTGYVGLVTGVDVCQDAYQVAADSDALIVVTEWNEFKPLDKGRILSLMRQPYLIDGRYIHDREEVERMGFVYWGLGRGMAAPWRPGQDGVPS